MPLDSRSSSVHRVTHFDAARSSLCSERAVTHTCSTRWYQSRIRSASWKYLRATVSHHVPPSLMNTTSSACNIPHRIASSHNAAPKASASPRAESAAQIKYPLAFHPTRCPVLVRTASLARNVGCRQAAGQKRQDCQRRHEEQSLIPHSVTFRSRWARGRAVRWGEPVVEGDVDDPEDDLRLGAPGTMSNTATSQHFSCWLGARAVNRSVRRTAFAARCQGSNTVTFGEVTPPPRIPVAFLLTVRREIVADGGRRKSAADAALRATRRVAAISVCNASFDAPNATPRVTTAPPPETFKLTASRG